MLPFHVIVRVLEASECLEAMLFTSKDVWACSSHTSRMKATARRFEERYPQPNPHSRVHSAAQMGIRDLVHHYLDDDPSNINLALQGAASKGQWELCKSLLLRGATCYDAALYNAAKSDTSLKPADCEMFAILLKMGADIREGLIGAARCGSMLRCDLFMRWGADDLTSALEMVAAAGHPYLCEWFIQLGATDYDDMTYALQLAALNNHLNTCKHLLHHGAASQENDMDRTLFTAAHAGHVEMCKLFIKHGASDFNEALQVAGRAGHIGACRLFLELGSDADAGLYAAFHVVDTKNASELFKMFIDNGAYIQNAALQAIERRILPALRLLIDLGANVDVCLMLSVICDYQAACEYCLQKGVRPAMRLAAVDMAVTLNRLHLTDLLQ